MYIPVDHASFQELSVNPDFVYRPNRMNLGTGDASGACLSTPPRGLTPPMIGPVRTAPRGEVEHGWLVAWDPITQKERWAVCCHSLRDGGGGGTLTTAANLVFQTVGSPSRLRVYSADKGEKLLDAAVPGDTIGPPITFLLDGKQHVVFASKFRTPADVLPPEGSLPRRAPHTFRLYAFVLDGKTPMP